MQLSSNGWPLQRTACAAVLMLAAAGCGKGNAAGDATPVADAGGTTKSASYVLVTRLRPEAPEKFRPQARAAYVTCTGLAKLAHFQVKPFPVLSPDFVTERTTYAGDGKRFMVRTVSYELDPQEMTPEHACEFRIKKRWNTALIADGQLRSGNVDEHGKVSVDSGEAPLAESPSASRLAMYTASKRINGVALKCSADDNCIVDPAVAVVAQGRRPVLAAYRNDDTATYGTALILEPVSLTVGKPIDPAVFDVAKGE